MFELPAEYLASLNKLMKDVTKILDSAGVKYWTEGGTLLGQIRDGGQIKHDDDIDLAVLHKDMHKVLKLKQEFEKLGYMAGYCSKSIYKINIPGWPVKIGEYWVSTPTIDIFEYKEKNGEVVLFYENHRKVWPNSKHLKTDLFPLVARPFDDMMINSPNHPEKYLTGLYNNWQEKKIYLQTDEPKFIY